MVGVVGSSPIAPTKFGRKKASSFSDLGLFCYCRKGPGELLGKMLERITQEKIVLITFTDADFDRADKAYSF